MIELRTMLALSALGLAAPATAQNYTTDGNPQIVERNAQGKATKVLLEGKVYAVCMSEQQDSCIQPRAAGLNWGDVPLRYWPEQPARSTSASAAR